MHRPVNEVDVNIIEDNNNKGCASRHPGMGGISPTLTAALLVAVCSGVLGVSMAQEECQFPAYLQTDPLDPDDFWYFGAAPTLGYEGRLVFINDTLLPGLSHWGIPQDPRTNVTCESAYGEDVFLVSYVNRSETGYACMSFMNHTDKSVRMSLTTTMMTGDDYQCSLSGSLEVPFDSLLLYANERDPVRPLLTCPLVGGFYGFFTAMQGDKKDEPLCQNNPVPTLLEAECLGGDGILLSFPDPSCIPSSSGWTQNQHLYCLDWWQDRDQDFIILGEEDLYPKWCLTLPTNRADVKDAAHLYPAGHCPRGKGGMPNGIPYWQIILHPLAESGACVDTMVDCTSGSCDSDQYRYLCPLSCGVCDETTTDTGLCSWDDRVPIGSWAVHEETTERHLQITQQYFTLEDFGNFSCAEKVFYYSYVMRMEKRNNTCRDRYTCVKFNVVSESIVQFQIAQERYSYDSAAELCLEKHFRDDDPPLGNAFRSQHMKTAIADGEDSIATTSCGFRGSYDVNVTWADAPDNCSHCAGHVTNMPGCADADVITFGIHCCGETTVIEFECLGSSTFGPEHGYTSANYVILRSTIDGNVFYFCAIFSEDNSAVPFAMAVLPTSQCSPDTPFQILTAGQSVFLLGAGLRNDSCDVTTAPTTHWPETTSGEMSTAAPTTVSSTTSTQPTSRPSVTQEPDGTMQAQHESESTNVGRIIGIVFGVVGGVIFILAILFFAWRFYSAGTQPYRTFTGTPMESLN